MAFTHQSTGVAPKCTTRQPITAQGFHISHRGKIKASEQVYWEILYKERRPGQKDGHRYTFYHCPPVHLERLMSRQRASMPLLHLAWDSRCRRGGSPSGRTFRQMECSATGLVLLMPIYRRLKITHVENIALDTGDARGEEEDGKGGGGAVEGETRATAPIRQHPARNDILEL